MVYTTAREVRAQIGNVGFGYYVRMPGRTGGPAWCGPDFGSKPRCDKLMGRLCELGYSPFMHGKPGTSGEFIIEFYVI